MYPNSDFHHLHVHTEFSVLDGLAKVSKLVKHAKKLGFRSLAITDHGSMQGAVKFYNACMEEDDEDGLPPIKPIIGTETYLCDNIDIKSGGMRGLRHIILIAKNYVGYQNLMKLSTRSYLEGFYYKSRIDFKMLEEHAEGLICSTACIDGYIPNLILQERYDEASANTAKMKDIFGDDFYLEVMYHGMEMEATVIKHMIPLSKKHDVKIIATNDVHYAKKEHAQAQEVLMAIEMRKSMRDPSRYHLPTPNFYLRTAEEMAEVFCPEMEYALKNTNEIYEKIDLKIKPDSENVPMLLPEIEMPEEVNDEHEYLIQLAREGLAEYGKQGDPEYIQRLEYELDGIKQTGFSRYFIMVWDYVNFCREKGIRIGAGRGSGCGSLVLFCLKITKLDPIKFDLLFERFLNTERISWPDIDIDFAHTRRREVFEYIISKYGRERTGKIGTNQTFKARGAIRFCVKHLDPCDDFGTGEKRSFILSDEIAKSVPFDPKIKLKDAYGQSPELMAFRNQHPRIFEIAETVEGVSTRPSVHAAGIVAAPGNIEDFVPLHTTSGGQGKTREICTQYAMEDLEEIGLVKFDILGLNTLTVIDRCLGLIKDKYFDIKIDIDDIPLDDPATLKLFRDGKTDGVFQMESYGMKKLLQDMNVDSIDDVIAANALYRPGALQAEAHIKYANCKNGRESIETIQEEVDEVLAPTYGQIVYQEQVMHISKIVAGFTGGQADSLRKAIGKKKGKIFKELKEEFFEGSEKLKKITKRQAEDIWQKFEFFGGYAFNKSLYHNTLVRLVNGGSKRICDFQEGDKVWCFNGKKKVPTDVVALHDHGFLDMFEVEFDDGAKVKCSINHKFLTPHGMQPLHAILEQKLEVYSNNDRADSRCVSLREVVSVQPVGEGHVYDLEVAHPTHNFILANGLVTSNSHSAAYGLIAYQTAYLKCHYPIEFMVATLTVEAMDQKHDNVEEYIKVCKRAGIEILPLDVNKSQTVFTEEDKNIRRSLISVKGVGSKAADNISETQPYNDLEDFCMKTDGSVLNTAVVGALAEVGAFNAFGKKKDIILAYPEVRAMAENKKDDTTKKMFDIKSESRDLSEYVKKAKVKNSQQKIQRKNKKTEKKSMF